VHQGFGILPGLFMSHAVAKTIIDLVLRHVAEQTDILMDLHNGCTDEEYKIYSRMIGRSMGTMLIDVINPIVEKYPDLKPDGLKE
jgi:hypothetical protein